MRLSISIAVAASFFALSLAGCKPAGDGGGVPPSRSGEAPSNFERERTLEQVKPKDAKVAEFQAGVKKFIEEARSLTRAMELLPDRASYMKRIESLQEAYSRIPDPPAANETLSMTYKAARQITVNFKVGDLYRKLIDDYLRLNSEEGAEKSVKQFREFGNRQRADLEELEAAINEGRVPKIELSDVTKGKK